MCPGKDGSLWADFDARPVALLNKAFETSVGSSGSGGAFNQKRAFICRAVPSGRLTTSGARSECPLSPKASSHWPRILILLRLKSARTNPITRLFF